LKEKSMSKNRLRIIPLGGLGEVGKNMMVYEYGKNILVVDAGLMFPDNEMLGIDYIIPDYQYLKDNKDLVRGLVITHGHMDHVGAIGHLLEDLNVPIYATPLTKGLIEVSLSENGQVNKASIQEVHAGEKVKIGPFEVEFFHVCHSIPDSVGLGISCPDGLVVHTGDYKFDPTPVDGWPTDFAKLAEFSGRGVLALLADSTNADKPGWTPSEMIINDSLDKVFQSAPGRIIVASFASLVSRMQQVIDAAERYGRKIAFVGYSMKQNSKMAKKLGYLDLPDGIEVGIDEALKMKPKEVVLMATGSQGEPYSIMGKLARGTDKKIKLIKDDTVVLSSHAIPGNEETVYKTINSLFRRGANVVYEPLAGGVHVSGHANQDEMKLMLTMVNPRYLIPIHGELRHLKQHAVLAKETGFNLDNVLVIENGQVIEFEDGKLQIKDRIPGSYVFVDGSRVGEIGPSVVREREQLAQDGVVLISLVLEGKGKLHEEPEIISRGFVYKHDEDDIIEDTRNKVIEIVEKTQGDLHNELIQSIRSFLYNKTKKRPVVLVTLTWL
jgi:ribonuclease J